jgi:CubicO group peptidase (beta-lactamase class C family)
MRINNFIRQYPAAEFITEMKKIFVALFLLPLSTCFGQEIRHIADSIRIRRRVPALTYAVFNSDSIFNIGAVGYKKLRTKDTVSLYNRYHLGSATVSLTAFIAAQLVNKGKISWNTSLFKLFPVFKTKSTTSYKDITLSDLLSQRTSLPSLNNYNDLYILPVFAGSLSEKRIATAEWILYVKSNVKDSIPENRFFFTNANAEVASIMLEKASGKSWEDLVAEYINKPLGISVKSGFPNKLDSNQPSGHWSNEGGIFHALPPEHWFIINPVYAPAADANLTLPDYVKFIQDELKGIKGMKAILPQPAYELLVKKYAFYSPALGNPKSGTDEISGIDGTAGSFYCHAEIIAEKNMAIIVMANGGDNASKAAVLNLAMAIREAFIK